jgi:polysaccharide biosynthesis/export protein
MKYSKPIFLVVALLLSSCVIHKDYKYLIPVDEASKKDSVNWSNSPKDYVLQVGDIIDLKVASNVTGSEVEVFNKRFQSNSNAAASNTLGSYFTGYLIEKDGYIEVPLIGKVKAQGLSCIQLNDTMQVKVAEFINYASVTTRLGIFRVTILGEVNAPGTKEITNPNNLTIFQAIGLAGDVTDIGNKRKIKLVRKNGDKIKVVKLDLSSISMIGSEYYYIQPNDVIYVEPLKAKVLRSNSANIALALSGLTFLLVLINYIKK